MMVGLCNDLFGGTLTGHPFSGIFGFSVCVTAQMRGALGASY
jgi:hypothetical protein